MSEYDQWYAPGKHMLYNKTESAGLNHFYNNMATWCALMCLSMEKPE